MTEKDIKDKGKMEHATGEGNFVRWPSGDLIVGLYILEKKHIYILPYNSGEIDSASFYEHLILLLSKMEWFANITRKSSWKK